MHTLNVAVLYNRNDRGLSYRWGRPDSGTPPFRLATPNNNSYRFFVEGLGASDRINCDVITNLGSVNPSDYKHYDALIIYDIWSGATDYNPLESLNIVKVVRCPDSHKIKPAFIDTCRRLKINLAINMQSTQYLRKFLPKDIPYRVFMFGINKELLLPPPWEKRRKDKVLQTGAVSPGFYHLRRLTCAAPEVQYVGFEAGFVGDLFIKLLGQFAAGIAACTKYSVYKYCESPMSGALTFMEMTELNDCERELGYIDGETAIFINEGNYREKMAEYLDDPDNPRWRQIAEAGREYTLGRWENRVQTDRLIDLLYEMA